MLITIFMSFYNKSINYMNKSKNNKSQKNRSKKLKCVLEKNDITYSCMSELANIWKKEFNGKYKITKYKVYFKLNNNTAILDIDKDTSLTRIIYNDKHISVNLENNPYKVLQKIKRLLIV